MTLTHQDLTIRMLADSEAEFIERVRDLSAERDSYRALAQEGIHALHHLTRERDALRRQLAAAREECRKARPAHEEAA